MPKPAAGAVKFLQIRPSPEQLDAYRKAADEDARSMNKWALRALDKAAGFNEPKEKDAKKGR